MTTKVLEANDGVFSTGLAVAPVTDWRYYGNLKYECHYKIYFKLLVPNRLCVHREIHEDSFIKS